MISAKEMAEKAELAREKAIAAAELQKERLKQDFANYLSKNISIELENQASRGARSHTKTLGPTVAEFKCHQYGDTSGITDSELSAYEPVMRLEFERYLDAGYVVEIKNSPSALPGYYHSKYTIKF